MVYFLLSDATGFSDKGDNLTLLHAVFFYCPLYALLITTNISQERGMEITEITVTLRNEDKLKAFVNVTFENKFVVRGMKVIKGASGFFVSMPSRKMPDGSFRDIAHPINNDFRQFIEDAILKEYYRVMEQGQEPGSSNDAEYNSEW